MYEAAVLPPRPSRSSALKRRTLTLRPRFPAEAARQTGRQRLDDLFMQAPAMIAIMRGPTHIFELANPLYLQVVGKTAATIIGKSVAQVFPELHGQGVLEILDTVYATGERYIGNEMPIRLDQNNGGTAEEVYFNFVYQPVRDAAGNVTGVMTHAVDVTGQVAARHHAERLSVQGKQQAQAFDVTLAAIEDFIYTFDVTGKFTYANKSLLELLGLTLDQVVGRDFHHLPYPAALATSLHEQIAQVVATGNPITAETPYVNPAGHAGYYEYIFTPVCDAHGAVVMVVGSTRDITARKRAEESLIESEVRFRTMAEGSAILIAIADETGNATYFNHAWVEMTGRPVMDFLQLGWVDLIHPEDRDEYVGTYLRAFVAQESFSGEFRIQSKNGDYRWLLSRVPARFRPDGSFAGYVSSCIDITERKQAEESLRTSEAKLRRLFDANMIGIVFYSASGEITEANRYFLDLIGYTARELREGGITWQQLTPPEFAPLDAKALADIARDGHCAPFEKAFMRKDGHPVPVLVGSAALTDDGEAGVAFVVDITAQRALEQQKDAFIGIASHELKTPVTSIKGYTQLLGRRFRSTGDERAADMLGKLETQVNRLTGLIEDLLDATRIESGNLRLRPSVFDLNALIREVADDIQRTAPRHTIIYDGAAPVITLAADRNRIGQVLTNLLTNAIRYSPGADRILVRTERRGGSVATVVQDFGIGIPAVQQAHVFERFYRVDGKARAIYPGLGLGLFIAAEFVRRHGGDIRVESEEGIGTAITFLLPLEAVPDPERDHAAERDGGGGEAQ